MGLREFTIKCKWKEEEELVIDEITYVKMLKIFKTRSKKLYEIFNNYYRQVTGDDYDRANSKLIRLITKLHEGTVRGIYEDD